MLTLHMLVLALATWRLSNLLVNEPGPFAVFDRLRFAAGIVINPHTEEKVPLDAEKQVAQILLCVWCTSIWVAAALLLLYWLLPVPTFWFAAWLALSALACLFDIYNEGGG